MMVIVLVCMAVMNRFGEREKRGVVCENSPGEIGSRFFMLLVFLFLYLPIFVLIVSSPSTRPRAGRCGPALPWIGTRSCSRNP